jgi:hypothetical protein
LHGHAACILTHVLAPVHPVFVTTILHMHTLHVCPISKPRRLSFPHPCICMSRFLMCVPSFFLLVHERSLCTFECVCMLKSGCFLTNICVILKTFSRFSSIVLRLRSPTSRSVAVHGTLVRRSAFLARRGVPPPPWCKTCVCTRQRTGWSGIFAAHLASSRGGCTCVHDHLISSLIELEARVMVG